MKYNAIGSAILIIIIISSGYFIGTQFNLLPNPSEEIAGVGQGQSVALSAPTNLAASAASSSSIVLSWTDKNTKQAGYYIERSTSASSGFTQITSVGLAVRSYQNNGLTASTTYYYRVRAYAVSHKTNSYSSYSNVASVTTPGLPGSGSGSSGGGGSTTTAPTISLTSPAAGSTVSGTAALAATASDQVGVTKVVFYMDSSLITTDTAAPYTASYNTTLTTNASHTFSAVAYNAAGLSATSSVNVTVSNAADGGVTGTSSTPVSVSICSTDGNVKVQGTPSTFSIYLLLQNPPYYYNDPPSAVVACVQDSSGTFTNAYILPGMQTNNVGNLVSALYVASSNRLYVVLAQPLVSTAGKGPFFYSVYQLATNAVSATSVSYQKLPNSDYGAPFETLKLKSGAAVFSWFSSTAGAIALQYVRADGTLGSQSQSSALRASYGLAQHPTDGSVWLFTMGDATGAVNSSHYTETSSGLTYDWNVADQIPGSNEISGLIPVSDPSRNAILLPLAAAVTRNAKWYCGQDPSQPAYNNGGGFLSSNEIAMFSMPPATQAPAAGYNSGSNSPSLIADSLKYTSLPYVGIPISVVSGGKVWMSFQQVVWPDLHCPPSRYNYYTAWSGSGTDSFDLPKLVDGNPTINGYFGTLPPPVVTSDTVPPTISITSPANGSTISGNFSTLAVAASDDTGVIGVQYYVDGQPSNYETPSPFSRYLNTRQFVNGTHTITAVARDMGGNVTTSAPVTVQVNNAPDTSHMPGVSLSPISNGFFTAGQNSNISVDGTAGAANDDLMNLGTGLALQNIMTRKDGGTWQPVSYKTTNYATSWAPMEASFSLPVALNAMGLTTVDVKVTDTLNNTSTASFETYRDGTNGTAVTVTGITNSAAYIDLSIPGGSYYFDWGPSTSYGTTLSVNTFDGYVNIQATTGLSLLSLSPNTTYHLRLRNSTWQTPDITFTTLP
jgi:hypothetical protein